MSCMYVFKGDENMALMKKLESYEGLEQQNAILRKEVVDFKDVRNFINYKF